MIIITKYRSYKHGNPERFAQFAFAAFDKDKSGGISFQEFILSTSFMIKQDSSHESQMRRLELAFSIFDSNNDQRVDAKELQALFYAIAQLDGQKPENTKKKVQEIMKKYDLDNNKSLSKAEFIEALLNENIFKLFHA